MAKFKVIPEDYPYNVFDFIMFHVFEKQDSKHFNIAEDRLPYYKRYGNVRTSTLSKEQITSLMERFVRESRGKNGDANLKAFRMYFKEGVFFSNIASSLGVTQGAVEMNIYKSLKAISNKLEHFFVDANTGRSCITRDSSILSLSLSSRAANSVWRLGLMTIGAVYDSQEKVLAGQFLTEATLREFCKAFREIGMPLSIWETALDGIAANLQGYPYNLVDDISKRFIKLWEDGGRTSGSAEHIEFYKKYGDLRHSPLSRTKLVNKIENLIRKKRDWDAANHITILRERYNDGLSVSEIAKRHGVSRSAIEENLWLSMRVIGHNLKSLFILKEVENKPIEQPITLNTELDKLQLSVRSYNCLIRGGYRTVSDVCLNQHNIKNCRNLGEKSLKEIVAVFHRIGFPLDPNIVFAGYKW